MTRAYSVLVVKALDEAKRTISGVASTPEPDRRGDILEPLGATFANPIPLLLHHDKERPVGTATLAADAAGITFEASFATVDAPGPLRDRVDEAWQSVVAKLIRGVSIGFRPLKNGLKFLKDGGIHFTATEVVELSLVTVPANVDATILKIKSLDAPHLAAIGRTPSGVSDPHPGIRKMAKQTATEQIATYEGIRKTKDEKKNELMQAAVDAGVTLDAAQSEEYDGLVAEIKQLDLHLERLRATEAYEKTVAAPVVPAVRTSTTPVVPAVRTSTTPVIQIKSNLPAGTAFTRICMAVAHGKGYGYAAEQYAKQWDDSTPEVGLFLKAAVAPGNTTDSTWAGPLAQYQNIANEFLELLRPETIIGKVPGLRKAPFLSQVPTQTAGGSYGWVGQAAPKPVTSLGFGTKRLEISKAAGIIVLTEELVKTSTPSAEAIVRADMIAGIAAFLDTQFIDPAVAAVAGVNPASITNGLVAITSTDDPLADLHALLSALSTANIPLRGVTIILSETNALAMGLMRDSMGNRLFPNVGVTGGSTEGMTVIASNAAGTNVIAFQPSAILYADEGGVNIDVSREASVQMNTTPDNPATATTVLVSLWQNNLVGLRAERWINWARARDAGVQYVSGANYTIAASTLLASRRAASTPSGRPAPSPERR
jgi:HK97 family phage major capsid protein/HK97 family phage prohead protease